MRITGVKLKYIFAIVIAVAITGIILSCRPPQKFVKNKENYYKSSRKKNRLTEFSKLRVDGTYISIDNDDKFVKYSLLRFNPDQTVQITRYFEQNLLYQIDSINYLFWLEDKVSYYFYVSPNKDVLTLERFEYWDGPWWNFFVQDKHYLVEKFAIEGDTLINLNYNNKSRFRQTYTFDGTLKKNHAIVENEFIRKK